MPTANGPKHHRWAVVPPSEASYTAIAVHWDGGFDVFVVHVTRGLIGQTRARSQPDIVVATRSYLEEQGQAARGAQIRVLVS